MNKMQEQVRRFHREVLDHTTSPAEPMLRNPELRAALILEEAIETVAALVGGDQAATMLNHAAADFDQANEFSTSAHAPPNLAAAIDGICDTIFVCLGTAEDIGIDIEPFFDEVSRSNMAKADPDKRQKIQKTPLGKGIKPPGWTPPDIAGILERTRIEWRTRGGAR